MEYYRNICTQLFAKDNLQGARRYCSFDCEAISPLFTKTTSTFLYFALVFSFLSTVFSWVTGIMTPRRGNQSWSKCRDTLLEEQEAGNGLFIYPLRPHFFSYTINFLHRLFLPSFLLFRKNMGDKMMVDLSRNLRSSRCAVVSSKMDEPDCTPFVFRSYGLPCGSVTHYEGSSKYKVWEANRASTAAPGFFSEFRLDGVVHQDGGLLSTPHLDWLIDGWMYRLFDQSIDWLIDWWIDWLIDCLIDVSIVGSVDCSVDWLIGWSLCSFFDSPVLFQPIIPPPSASTRRSFFGPRKSCVPWSLLARVASKRATKPKTRTWPINSAPAGRARSPASSPAPRTRREFTPSCRTWCRRRRISACSLICPKTLGSISRSPSRWTCWSGTAGSLSRTIPC